MSRPTAGTGNSSVTPSQSIPTPSPARSSPTSVDTMQQQQHLTPPKADFASMNLLPPPPRPLHQSLSQQVLHPNQLTPAPSPPPPGAIPPIHPASTSYRSNNNTLNPASAGAFVGRPLARSTSSNSFALDGSSRQLTPRQLRSYEQSDGTTNDSAVLTEATQERKQRPILLTTPRIGPGAYASIADRSPIPRTIQTIPIDTVAMPDWHKLQTMATANTVAALMNEEAHTGVKSNTAPSVFSPDLPSESPTDNDESVTPDSVVNNAAQTNNNASATLPPATPSLVRRASLAVFQSLAVQKLTLEHTEMGLEDWLHKSKELMQIALENEKSLPPIDLRGENAAQILSEFVSATLEMDINDIRAVQVVAPPPSTSNIHASTSSVHSPTTAISQAPPPHSDHSFHFRYSGDAVSLILNISQGTPKLVGAVKVFANYKTFELELNAIVRMHEWLQSHIEFGAENNQLQLKDDNKQVDSSPPVVSIPLNSIATSPTSSSSSAVILRVPRPISAHFALTPTGKGGVLVVAPAEGSPLDEYFLSLAMKRANAASQQDCDQAWQTLKAGIGCAAVAFFQLHTLPRGSGGKVRKKYMQRYVSQLNNIFDRIKESLPVDSEDFNAYVKLFPKFRHLLDMNILQQRLQPIIESALSNRGKSCICHGDAHMGNVFYSDEKSGGLITLIDVATVNLSVGEHGEPIGCAARDIANMYQKISLTGMKHQFSQAEIHHLQAHFLDSYERKFVSSGLTSPLTMESFHFFHLRSIIGELHRNIKTLSLQLPLVLAIDHALLQAETFQQRKLTRTAAANQFAIPSTPGVTHGLPNSSTLSLVGDGDEDDQQDDRVALQLLNEELLQEKLAAEEAERKELEKQEIREQDKLAEGGSMNHTEEEEEERDLLFDDEYDEETTTSSVAPRLGGIVNPLYSFSPTIQARQLPPPAGRFSLNAYEDGLHPQLQPGVEPMFRQQSSVTPQVAFQPILASLPSVAMAPSTFPILTASPPSSINGGRILVVLGAPLKPDLQTPDTWLDSRLKQTVSIFYRIAAGLSALLLSGGRSPGMEVSISKVMERFLRPFGIRSNSSRFVLLNEDMSSCGSAESYPRDLISQAFCIRSMLRMRGFRHGNILVICSDFQLASVCMVFNRIFKSSTGMITLEYIASPTPRAYAPDSRVEAARLKELPSLMKEMRGNFTSFAPYGRCSLLDAARAGSLQSMKLMVELLGGGTQLINAEKDSLGCSPLHLAAEYGFTDCCEYLLQHGADPNARSTLGATPLHFGTAMGRLDVVQLLLHYGGGPSRTLIGVCGRGNGRDCWIGSKRPCDMNKYDSTSSESTHELQDLQPIRSIITLLVQPESTTLEEANEDIRKEHEAARRMRLNRGASGASRTLSRSGSRSNLVSPNTTVEDGSLNSTGSGPDSSSSVPFRPNLEISPSAAANATLPSTPSSTTNAAASSPQPISNPTSTTPLTVASAAFAHRHGSTASSIPSPLTQYPNLQHKRIILLRHSESLWNVNGSHRVRGLIDTTLTNSGIKQATKFGSYLQQTGALQRLGIRLIVVSPLTRTLQTYMLTARWYVDLFPHKTAPAINSSNPIGGSPGNSPSHAPSPVSSPAIASSSSSSSVRVVVNADLAEQLLSTGTIGRSPQHLQKEFDDPTLDFSQLPPVWWYAPTRDLDAELNGNQMTGENSTTSPPPPTSSSTAPSTTASTSAAAISALSANTRVYLKREPLDHVRLRIHMFLHWLEEQPETSILVIGHGTYFRYLVDTELIYPDLFKSNLCVWRL